MTRNINQQEEMATGSQVQKPKPPEWLIENIAEASKNARKLYFLYIGFLAYCALTVVSTSDRQIILNETVNLPILRIDVSLNGFFLLAPLIAIFVFAYFQLYVNIRKKLINELKTDYPSTGGKRLYPWMLVALDFPGHTLIDRMQSAIVKFSVWCSLPLVLALISTWFVKRHDPILSYVIGLAPIAGTVVVLCFWWQYENVEFRILQVPRFLLRNWGKNILLFVVIAYEVTFVSFIIPMANKGFPGNWRKGCYQEYLQAWFCINLSHQKLVTEPETDYKGLYWGNFNEAHLERANLTNSVLNRADFRNAYLQYARMNSAILRGAHFGSADLQGADLQGASLRGANLSKANLRSADLRSANLSEASLRGAYLGFEQFEYRPASVHPSASYLATGEHDFTELQKAVLQYEKTWDIRAADLSGAVLKQADLQQAIVGLANLQGAVLEGADLRKANFGEACLDRANLRFADLRGADLSNASFEEANLEGACLEGAILRGAGNLTIEQLFWVNTLYKAELDSELEEQIKKRKDCRHLLEDP